MDLAARDSYIQKLASRVISNREQEPKKRPFVPYRGPNDGGPKKKQGKKKKLTKENLSNKPKQNPIPQKKPSPGQATQKVNGSLPVAAKAAKTPECVKFSTVDVLRKRLHEKIEESRGQGAPKDALSEAVQAKRAKRKLERERKKRKKKEFRMKKMAEETAQEQPPEIKEEEVKPKPAETKRSQTALIFNKVETVEERYVDKALKKKIKKESTKGKITPLTGRNYKQLLTRVEARKTKVEQLREKDEGKARELEEKIKWTNTLYKAEGLKIKDDEDMLRASLKRKEKMKAQKKKRWNERSENILEKMQKRQDKRRKNIQMRKRAKTEKKKEKARKRGRVLPEDLKKASV
ncbi:surfeit locus protein 6 [Synchiropus splendidus]|uniref:surfeit locus protein 6 n=1 Tax=Synchiropus splendidus TaxID=270530 RepID=UPI00237E9933|nr:surfeit locus protein 6 [Synchiropus splendidus]